MPEIQDTVNRIVEASSLNQRVALIRLVPQLHGTGEHSRIFAEVARVLYVPQLAPDFAYIHHSPFYAREFFQDCYSDASLATRGFEDVSEDVLAKAIEENPRILLVFRTITGLTREEFAQSTVLAGKSLALPPLSSAKVDSMERHGTLTTPNQAHVAASTISRIMNRSLFGDPPPGLLSKQEKPDTEDGWDSVRKYAAAGVPLAIYLHQRHFGGSFRQLLDATSTERGNLLEDAVEALFRDHGIPFIRTGSHNQAEIAARFEVRVAPAPDFVVFDSSGVLRAILECKGANDGGTARDKAGRYSALREESKRLGGIPLIAVLGGIGWRRVTDALGPVIQDTEGRVFTIPTLESMLQVSPFPVLVNSA